MSKFANNICILSAVSIFLTGCRTSVSDYFFCRARVSDDAILINNDGKDMYKVGDKYYAGAHRGRVRQSMKGLPYKSVVGYGWAYDITWVSDGDSQEKGYVLLDTEQAQSMLGFFSHTTAISTYFPDIDKKNFQFITNIPDNAQQVTYPCKLVGSNVHQLVNDIYTDEYAYVLYPIGCVSFVLIDVPLTLIGSFGAGVYFLTGDLF